MDRNSILAIVLISVLIFGYMFYSSINYEEQVAVNTADSTVVKQESDNSDSDRGLFEETESDSSKDKSIERAGDSDLNYGKFQQFTLGKREVVTIETDFMIAKISSKGGDLISYELKNYDKWDGEPTQLIQDYEGELFLEFISIEGKDIDSRNLYFDLDNSKTTVSSTGEQEYTLTATLEFEPGKSIVKKYK